MLNEAGVDPIEKKSTKVEIETKMEPLCAICQTSFLFQNDATLVRIVMGKILDSKNHIHFAILLFSDKPSQCVILKSLSNGKQQELIILKLLNQKFPESDKPHMTLLASHKEQSFTMLVIERGEMDLFDYINKYKEDHGGTPNLTLEVSKVKDILRKILRKLKMLHENGIAHLDVSLENIMYFNNDFFFIDFEFSQLVDKKAEFHFNGFGLPICDCGKELFMSTTRFMRNPFNALKEDIFAIGIVAFALLFDAPAFESHESSLAYEVQSGNSYKIGKRYRENNKDDAMYMMGCKFIDQCCSTKYLLTRTIDNIIAHPLLQEQ